MKQDRPAAKGQPKRERTSVDAPHDASIEHPVGTGVGAAAGGAAAGVAVGSVAGPVGTAVGAAAGALAGAVAGREVAQRMAEAEDAYWREHYAERPYVGPGARYEDYGPAYRYGVAACQRRGDCDFEAMEADLARGWRDAQGDSRLGWTEARPAAHDAWRRLRERAGRAAPGDADRDGR